MQKTRVKFSILLLIVVGFATYIVTGQKEDVNPNPKSERREVRENRRAERQAEMEQQIDSIVMARAFQFTPTTIQHEPAGRMLMLSNPQFEIGIYDGAADIFIPYISGITPPYRHSIINYTVPILNKYISIQTDNGWDVSFTTSLFSASEYKFDFEINAKFGTTTLTISNTWNNDVTYTGTISRYY